MRSFMRIKRLSIQSSCTHSAEWEAKTSLPVLFCGDAAEPATAEGIIACMAGRVRVGEFAKSPRPERNQNTLVQFAVNDLLVAGTPMNDPTIRSKLLTPKMMVARDAFGSSMLVNFPFAKENPCESPWRVYTPTISPALSMAVAEVLSAPGKSTVV